MVRFILLRTVSYDGVSRRSIRLESGSNGFHYRHGNGSRGCRFTGATVTATSQERGQTYTAVTNDSGLYRIAQLPVGTYALKVEKAGFASASYPAFVLTLNQVARIDVAMKVGQASETVEVSWRSAGP